ncbi:MAG TPA: hypothetical protein VHY09_16215 [Candidatus Methylacidiphilales bacterium]|jgi:hypothetical protein|nr:hypothetical protein [Candidatus Methylacidiphilales bacterium]
MRIALLTLVFIVTGTAGALARIGETPDQLVARYGQPINEVDQKAEGAKISLARVTFQKGGYQIDVTITGGLSVEEVFKKINGQPVTVEEAQILLNANAQGMEWSAPQKKPDALVWKRDDDAVAQLSSDGSMIIRSRELVVQETTAKHLEQRPSLDGF